MFIYKQLYRYTALQYLLFSFFKKVYSLHLSTPAQNTLQSFQQLFYGDIYLVIIDCTDMAYLRKYNVKVKVRVRKKVQCIRMYNIYKML